MEVRRPVPTGPDPGRRCDLSARMVQPSLPSRPGYGHSARREAAHGHSELGHSGQEKESNDYWACTTWGLVVGEDSRIRMLDRTMDRMEYVEGRQKVKDQYAKWNMVTAVLVEDSRSGQAILSDLRTTGI